VLYLIIGNLKARIFCIILDKFSRRAKSIRIIGGPDNQSPDEWSFTVIRIKNRHARSETVGNRRLFGSQNTRQNVVPAENEDNTVRNEKYLIRQPYRIRFGEICS
jgi:hypothetical protein